jgi:hypothetical protein
MLHGKIPTCMVVGSAHHVYLLKQPFQLQLLEHSDLPARSYIYHAEHVVADRTRLGGV